MFRLRRRLLNLLTLASLLLCVTAVVLWARSHWRWDLYRLHPDGRTYYALSFDAGLVMLQVTTYDRTVGDRTWWGRGWNWQRGGASPTTGLVARSPWNRLGFYYDDVVQPLTAWQINAGMFPQPREKRFVAPAWLLAFAAAPLPAWRLLSRLRRHSRIIAGLCPVCGYDLRASPGRCPECGTPAAS